MSWADNAIRQLQAGYVTSIEPRGNSMTGKVESGDRVVLFPIINPPEKDDIVLVKVKGKVYLHLVKAVQGKRFQIGNNRGGVNGWVGIGAIYGKAVSITTTTKV